jgi:hypothetical protein
MHEAGLAANAPPGVNTRDTLRPPFVAAEPGQVVDPDARSYAPIITEGWSH